jgi:hypothetical protein
MINSAHEQLSLSEQKDDLLDRLIWVIATHPSGDVSYQKVRARLLSQGLIHEAPLPPEIQPCFTSASVIRARLEKSRDQMRNELGCDELELAVIRNWYARNFELLPGDTETVSEDTNRKSPRWWRTLSNAVKGCQALKRVERDRYLIV